MSVFVVKGAIAKNIRPLAVARGFTQVDAFDVLPAKRAEDILGNPHETHPSPRDVDSRYKEKQPNGGDSYKSEKMYKIGRPAKAVIFKKNDQESYCKACFDGKYII